MLLGKFFPLVKKAMQGGAGNTQQFGGLLLISFRLGQGCGNIGRLKLVSFFHWELKGGRNIQMGRQVMGFDTVSPVIETPLFILGCSGKCPFDMAGKSCIRATPLA